MIFNYPHGISVLTDLLRKVSRPCALCHSSSSCGICEHCYRQYLDNSPLRCFCCGQNLPCTDREKNGLLCGNCLDKPHSFDETIVAAAYEPPLDQLVHELKFQSKLALAPLMGKLIYQAAIRQKRLAGLRPDFITAVPLGNSRLIERGFNQSHEIAKTFAKWMNVPLRSDLIYRNRDTEKQSTISFKERKNNVQGAFSITQTSHAILKGTHIGLVDDVMTTGHTLEEIAHLLKNAGTRRVTNFVFARTPA